ncbi:MAG: hypothetical protein BroJett011_42850 [Chloroflexota bacterium]|nr:MAG: hypothetical protein BroJett011_42850 [Chloroflexota bacterium]
MTQRAHHVHSSLVDIEVRLGDIIPGPYQNRRFFSRPKMAELVDSIEADGLINSPIAFVDDAGRYPLLSGERRWRALCVLALTEAHHMSREAALEMVSQPDGGQQLVDQWASLLDQVVKIRLHTSKSERKRYKLAITDNHQLATLTPIEEARDYMDMKQRFNLSDIGLARAVKKSANHVRATLRLLDLEAPIQQWIDQKRLHRDAKIVEALLSLPDPETRVKLARIHVEKGSSIQTIVDSCTRFIERLQERAEAEAQAAQLAEENRTNNQPPPVFVSPALILATQEMGPVPPPGERNPLTRDGFRQAVADTCATCSIRRADAILSQLPTPAWVIMSAEATGICAECPARHARTMCKSCPLLGFLERTIALYKRERTP